jgi:L-ascorbate metabolism protein UlaG (beta-lactamase superfamily)
MRAEEVPMELTKLGHSCVRIRDDGRTLVIDPGGFTEPDAAAGADAILITHEHPDHIQQEQVAAAVSSNPGVEVWTNASVAEKLDGLGAAVHTVGQGDAFSAAGFEVQAHGELHAQIHPDLPQVRNIGFLVGGKVFHPGDAYLVPGVPVEALFLPVHAPWVKIGDAVDYAREVAATRTFALHDGMLNERGLALLDGLLGGPLDLRSEYRRLASGETVPVE